MVSPLPALVERFGPDQARPTIAAGRRPGRRWEPCAYPDRPVSRTWLRELQTRGYTRLRLRLDGRLVELDLAEILRGS